MGPLMRRIERVIVIVYKKNNQLIGFERRRKYETDITQRHTHTEREGEGEIESVIFLFGKPRDDGIALSHHLVPHHLPVFDPADRIILTVSTG